MRQVAVWDLPTRIFHWGLVIAVAVSYLTGEEEGPWFVVHLVSGYAVAALILFRLAWGLIGSPRSRFGDFIYSPASIRAYARGLSRLRPAHFVGHNPLGGLMALALIALLAAVVLTGLVTGEPGEAAGPLAGWSGGAGGAVEEVHETLANLVVILAFVHIAAVFLDWAITGVNLIPAMIHGRKALDEAQAEREPALAGRTRALLLAGAVLVLLGLAVQQTDFAALAERDGDGDGHASLDHDDPAEAGEDDKDAD